MLNALLLANAKGTLKRRQRLSSGHGSREGDGSQVSGANKEQAASPQAFIDGHTNRIKRIAYETGHADMTLKCSTAETAESDCRETATVLSSGTRGGEAGALRQGLHRHRFQARETRHGRKGAAAGASYGHAR